MGLDMYLAKYHKPTNLEKLSFNREESEKLMWDKNGYDVFSECPPPLKDIATEISIIESYYDMEKISEKFANGYPLEIGCFGGGKIGFRNYEKGIKLDLDSDMIHKDYTINKEETAYVVEGDDEIAYWRKANQIRQWFVNHIKEFNDDDNCGYYKVTKELLEKLIFDCQAVLLSQEDNIIDEKTKEKIRKVKILSERGVDGEKEGAKATLEKMEKKYGLTGVAVKPEEILPTSDGFFFGNTEYNTLYFQQLKNTVEMLSKVIETVDWDNEIVVYTESW